VNLHGSYVILMLLSLAHRGKAIRELGIRRSDLIISTKVFFGVGRKGPNDRGLSRKHVIEGVLQSLERLQMDYGSSFLLVL
jgi:aryl-alcohol dehydrogenase-like predicted oxidoreductase